MEVCRERDTTLTILKYLFIPGNRSFVFFIDFQLIEFKTKLRFGFCRELVLKLSRIRGKRNKKTMFYFQIFETFVKLEIDFISSINECFCIKINSFGVKQLYSSLKRKNTQKLLGLFLDAKLNFPEHIDKKRKNC